MSTERPHDVVVIGAGVGGLTCAALLARHGLDVLVVEQSPRAGGCCSAFRTGGFVFDAAVHHVSGGGPRSLVGQALIASGAQVDMVRLDPMDTLVWPDLRFEVPGAWDALIATLIRSFPREALRLERLFAELLRLYRATLGNPGGSAVFERWGDSTYLDLLTAFVEDERLIRVLSGQWGYLGVPPARLSAIGMCQMLVNYWRDGAYYPRGGTQAIPDALVAAIEAAGGTVRTSCGARRIHVEGANAVAVELAPSTTVEAKAMVSNVDAPQTLTRLLGQALPPAYRTELSRMEVSHPFLLLYVGLSPEFEIGKLPRGFYHQAPRLDGPWLYVSSPSETDPNLAPPGKHSVTVVVSLDGAEGTIDSWKPAVTDAKVRRTISLLDGIAPGFTQSIEVLRYAHPPTRTRRAANFCGAPYGWAVTPEQAGRRRLASTTPIANLHLVGHWTTPGPGVCAVMASGWRTAKRLLRAIDRTSSHSDL